MSKIFSSLFCEMGLKRDDCTSLGEVEKKRGHVTHVLVKEVHYGPAWARPGECALMRG